MLDFLDSLKMKKLCMKWISPQTEELGSDQYDSEDSTDVFIGPTAEGDFVRLQRDFYQKYGEQKELSLYVWKAMHTTFPILSTSAIATQLSTGEDRELIKPSIFK